MTWHTLAIRCLVQGDPRPTGIPSRRWRRARRAYRLAVARRRSMPWRARVTWADVARGCA